MMTVMSIPRLLQLQVVFALLLVLFGIERSHSQSLDMGRDMGIDMDMDLDIHIGDNIKKNRSRTYNYIRSSGNSKEERRGGEAKAKATSESEDERNTLQGQGKQQGRDMEEIQIDCDGINDINDIGGDDDDSDEVIDRELNMRKLLCHKNNNNKENEKEEEEIIEELHFEDAMNKAVQGDADEIIRTVFHNLQGDENDNNNGNNNGNSRYLRVCAPVVLTSTLCITVRYPFPVTPPPSNGPNLRQMDQRYFELTNLVIVDGAKLDPYRFQSSSESETESESELVVATDEEVKKCLDDVAAEHDPYFDDGEPSVAVAVFTIKKQQLQEDGDGEYTFFGTRSHDQLHRVSQFYPDGEKVIIYGDSNVAVGSVASQTTTLWDHCTGAPKFANEVRYYCESPLEQEEGHRFRQKRRNKRRTRIGRSRIRRRRRMGFITWDELDQSKVFVMKLPIVGCDLNVTQRLLDFAHDLKDPDVNPNDGDELQRMSVIVQHSIAHIARQPDIINESAFEQTAEYQEICVKNTLEAMSTQSRAALAQAGFTLDHVIIFDGLTQHFPTETGAYAPGVHECRPGLDYCPTYPDWKLDDHGPLNCAGPIPKTSSFRKFLEVERIQYMKNGFDMRWYGMSWEFTNLFWWQHKSWQSSNGSLDCTHSVNNGGVVSMYKYFIQAMIDDYYS